jgi:hypothetical protein
LKSRREIEMASVGDLELTSCRRCFPHSGKPKAVYPMILLLSVLTLIRETFVAGRTSRWDKSFVKRIALGTSFVKWLMNRPPSGSRPQLGSVVAIILMIVLAGCRT